MTSRDIAIIGGGPIGIEAAHCARRAGHHVRVFERTSPGTSIAQWGHVRFFSPWELNRSSWGLAVLREAGVEPAPNGDYPMGDEYLRHYLRPLADTLGDSLRTGVEVRGVARATTLKGEHLAAPQRDEEPFTIQLERDGDAWYEQADVLLDCSGVYGTPNGLGPGGLQAIGETHAADRIERYIPDPLGSDRTRYAGRRVLVIGAGYSAATTVHLLRELARQEPQTRIIWSIRDREPPYRVDPEDPLPERRALGELANAVVQGHEPRADARPGTAVRQITRTSDGSLRVELTSLEGGSPESLEVDEIVANVGYRPDWSPTRELQVHLCWATEGPMKLAASLLAQSGGGDCLQQTSGGLDTLCNPEPSFFALGSKSYGRNSDFLLRIGYEQIETVVESL